MVLYFCDKCGKRIKVLDLTEGVGSNEKLAGVYCNICAASALALEMQPTSKARQSPAKPVTEFPIQSDPASLVSNVHPSAIKPRGRGAETGRSKDRAGVAEPLRSKARLRVLLLATIFSAVALGILVSSLSRQSEGNTDAKTLSPSVAQPLSLTPPKSSALSDPPPAPLNASGPKAPPPAPPVPIVVLPPPAPPPPMAPTPAPVPLDSDLSKRPFGFETRFDKALDPIWRIVSNAPNRIAVGAWRVDTTNTKEMGAALVSSSSYPLNRRYRFIVSGGQSGGTPGWAKQGQAWCIGVYAGKEVKAIGVSHRQEPRLEFDSYPVVPALLASVRDQKISLTRVNDEKLWSSFALLNGTALPPASEYEVTLEWDRESVALKVDGKEYFRGAHGLKNLDPFFLILRGCNWKDPKGREVWFRAARLEEEK